MKTKSLSARVAPLVGAAILIGFGQSAAGMSLNTSVSSIYQVGTGAAVHLGHVVVARTDFNRLTAGGTYSARCAHPDMLPLTGQRFLSTSNFSGNLVLTVTVPAQQPAEPAMPGFYSLTRGTQVSCTYEWVSRAVEGGYSIGAGGISYQIGNGERTEGGTQIFYMKVPGLADPNEGGVCIP